MTDFIDPIKFSTPSLDVKGAYAHSQSVSDATSKAVAEMIVQDARDHHVFFKRVGLHNHLIHILLADYSLGASEARLREIYKYKAPEQLPIQSERGVQSDFQWNSEKCLGEQDYYQSYLAFFQAEVQKLGIHQAIETYIFGGEGAMLERFVSGAYHPMIHTGYGVEFAIPMMVAEGLAQTAVHSSSVKTLFSDRMLSERARDIMTGRLETSCMSSATALQLGLKVHKDSRFDHLISFEESPKFKKLLSKSKACELLMEYVLDWNIADTTLDGTLEKSGELMALAAACYAGPQRPTQEATLDFFLMHGLTSSLFLPSFMQCLTESSRIQLLLAKFAVDLGYYVSRNRPSLDLAQFANSSREWPAMLSQAIEHDDEHVPKAIRALIQAEKYDTKGELANLANNSNVYRSMAELTLEGDGYWTQDGVGFEEVWRNVPNLTRPRYKSVSSL